MDGVPKTQDHYHHRLGTNILGLSSPKKDNRKLLYHIWMTIIAFTFHLTHQAP